MSAFEISAKNRKNRENNKRNKRDPRKSTTYPRRAGERLQPVGCGRTLGIANAQRGTRHAKSPVRSPPGPIPDCAFCHQTRNVSSPMRSGEQFSNMTFNNLRRYQKIGFVIPSCATFDSSCPRLSRASTSFLHIRSKTWIARNKPDRDGGESQGLRKLVLDQIVSSARNKS